MSGPPTDRGIAFIRRNDDSTKNVYVAMAVDSAGMPEAVFAVYRERRKVYVERSVEMVSTGSMTRTVNNVCVVSGTGGEVHILGHQSGAGALFS